jgi:aspartate oxidase
MASVDITDIRMALGISVSHGEIVHLLLENKVVSTADLLSAGVSFPRKVIKSLRDKMDPVGIEIHSHRRLGYWLDEAGKERMIMLCRQQAGEPEAVNGGEEVG